MRGGISKHLYLFNTDKKLVFEPTGRLFSREKPLVSIRPKTAEDYLALGQKQMKKGNYKMAVRRLNRSAGTLYNFSRLVCLAVCYDHLNDRFNAESFALSAINMDPKKSTPMNRSLLAVAHFIYAKNVGESDYYVLHKKGHYSKAIEYDPNLAEAHFELAKLMGPTEEGMAQAVEAFVRRASAKLKKGDFKGAIRDCDSAEEVRAKNLPDMKDSRIHTIKAEAYYAQGNYISALSSALDALKIDPDNDKINELVGKLEQVCINESVYFKMDGIGRFYVSP